MINVQHWEAFTRQPGKGNPAGIVLDAHGLSDQAMQSIASAIGFNDTAFILPSQDADFRIRFFSPRREVELCGHATIAAFSALHRSGQLVHSNEGGDYTLETKVGVLPIRVDVASDMPLVVMTQGNAQFKPFNGDRDELARAIGVTSADFHATLPIIFGSTGRWTLLVPVKNLEVMRRMRPYPDKSVFD